MTIHFIGTLVKLLSFQMCSTSCSGLHPFAIAVTQVVIDNMRRVSERRGLHVSVPVWHSSCRNRLSPHPAASLHKPVSRLGRPVVAGNTTLEANEMLCSARHCC